MIDQEPRLKIAIQKSGRLADESTNLLRSCGLNFENGGAKLFSPVRNFPLDIEFLRDDDIPGVVERNSADLGIVGNNVIEESTTVVDQLLPLGFGRCRLTVGVPTGSPYQTLEDLRGKRIATSYINITGSYFTARRIPVNLIELKGSVEIAPTLGDADAIADLTSTGSTMASNGLRPIENIFESQAHLIANREIDDRGKQKIIDRLMLRIKSVLDAKLYKYIALNAPKSALERVLEVMPGLKSPTVTPLANLDWVSVHSVLPEDNFWDFIELLREAGAQGIIVLPIEKMVL